jgi:sec-independent protein translocase protein TatB
MHVGDTIFIFCLALIIFGPKKLPEIGRQIGKLMVEFRRASNEFKMQIEEELRASEQAERQKEISARPVMTSTAAGAFSLPNSGEPPAPSPAPSPALSTDSTAPVIAPPSTGIPVNHTFAPVTPTIAETPAPIAEDAYPEPANGFNAGLNTASNGLIAELPAPAPSAFHREAMQPLTASEAETPEIEKAQAPLTHG